jgi:hypothetical protein
MKKIAVFIFLLINLNPVFSQYGEIGFSLGGSLFLGDVHSQIPDNLGLSAGVGYRLNANSRWAWRSDFRYLQLSGNDANSSNEFELQRNLNFTSNAFQFATHLEFNFFSFEPYNNIQSRVQGADIFTPYVSIGISLLHHNPKSTLAGNEYELRPLMTEGVEYSKIVIGVPLGFGFKFRLADRLIMGLCGELTPVFSDYLDDVSYRYPEDPASMSKTSRDLSNRTTEAQGLNNVSWGAQRGDDYVRDWLSSVVITVNYNLRKNPTSCHYNPNK